MSKPFNLVFKAEGLADRTLSGELADDEYEILDCYLEQYKQLSESKPVREGFPCEFSLSGSEGKPIETKALLPDEDTLSILLHRMRPFILQNENASYAKVSSLIGKRLSDPYIRQLLREQRQLYDGRNAQKQMRVSSKDVIVNSERILCDWLNSHEYHRDPDKREAIDELFKLLPSDFMRALMVSMLVDKVRAITNIARLVAVILGKNEKLRFQAHDLNKMEPEEST